MIDIDNFFNNDVILSSFVTNLNSSTAHQKIVNWVTTADGCVHTADATQLDSWVPVGVGGVYWALHPYNSLELEH